MKMLYIILICALYAALNVTGAAVIKNQIAAFQKEGHQFSGPIDFVNFLFRVKVILGFVIILLSALTLFKALSMQAFSFVVPVSNGINFVLTVVIGVLFFNDRVSLGQYVGLLLIITGILLVSLSARNA